MNLRSTTTYFYWLFFIVLCSCIDVASAAGNFVPVHLPNGVTVELPKNWTVLTNNQRITLDSWVQAKTEALGLVDAKHDLAFAANYYDDQGKTAAKFNIRYYPDLRVTQIDAQSANAKDIKELDILLQQTIAPEVEMAGGRLLTWVGTTKQKINGAIAFVTEYQRSSRLGGSFRVRLVRFFNGNKSFTATVSYREDQDFLLRPICDRIINTVRF